MMRMRRLGDASPYLSDNAARWTAEYVARKRADASHRFRWPEVSHRGARMPLNQHLLPELLAITAQHCAYCDGHPLGEISKATIDHFRPKGDARFLHLVLDWENLFPACNVCQDRKADSFDEKLLKPDEPPYDFDRYFDYNFRTHELEPRRDASVEDQERGRITIQTLGLNLVERCESRRRHFEWHYRDAVQLSREELDALPYRYLAPPPP
jgi:uncharacterized protein (TIGR02646 family)